MIQRRGFIGSLLGVGALCSKVAPAATDEKPTILIALERDHREAFLKGALVDGYAISYDDRKNIIDWLIKEKRHVNLVVNSTAITNIVSAGGRTLPGLMLDDFAVYAVPGIAPGHFTRLL